jgi:hypothetical protein
MADGTQLNAPTTVGDIIATDEIDGQKHQRVKNEWGADGVANEVDDVEGKRLPIKVGSLLAASSVVAGQISLSGAEAALSTVAGRRFRLKADTDNDDKIYLGPTGVSASNGYPLWQGDMLEVQVSNLNVVHAVVGSGTQKLHYLGEV